MPSLSQKLPSYRRHKASGQAVVTLSGRDHYLGPYGTNASKLEYDRVIAEWIANGRQLSDDAGTDHQITIVELIAAYWKHATQHYVKKGQPTAEQDCIRSALKPLRELYGTTEAKKFGPLALKAVRERMVERDWSRDYVNKSLSRIRRMFRWGVENEIVPVTVLQALQAIQGLQAGRTKARETPGRHPVPKEHIEAVKRALRKQIHKDLIDLGLLTGARPGELVSLTTTGIDTSRPVWVAKIGDHKMIHRGKERFIYFGPKAQLILTRYLNPRAPEKPIFGVRRAQFAKTVKLACLRIGIPRWTPHWLRHSCGSYVRSEFGAEAAQAILGHSHLSTTEIYAEKSARLAREVSLKVG